MTATSITPEEVERMIAYRKEGRTYASIGKEFGVTGEWVRLLTADEVDPEEVKRQRELARTKALVEAVQEHPLWTVNQLASHLGLSRARVLSGLELNNLPIIDPFPSNKSGIRFTDKELEKYVRQAVSDLGNDNSLSEKEYSSWRESNPGAPSAATYEQRFLNWSSAMEEYGIQAPTQPGRKYTRSTRRDALDLVIAYVKQCEGRPTYTGYGKWAGENGALSAQTIRNRLGTWGEAVEEAYKEIILNNDEDGDRSGDAS